MDKFIHMLKTIFKRSIFLYVLLALLLFAVTDREKIDIRVLSYLRNSALYVNQFVSGDKNFDRVEFHKAVRYYEKLLAWKPKATIGYGVIGYCYYYLGDYENAIQAYTKTIEDYPDLFGFYYNLGLTYYKNGQWQQAVNAFEQAIAISPESSFNYYMAVSEKNFPVKQEGDAWVTFMRQRLMHGYEESMILSIQGLKKLGKEQLIPLHLEKSKNFIKIENIQRELDEDELELFYYIPLFETGVKLL